jgi:hypothetical protein
MVLEAAARWREDQEVACGCAGVELAGTQAAARWSLGEEGTEVGEEDAGCLFGGGGKQSKGTAAVCYLEGADLHAVVVLVLGTMEVARIGET